MLKIDEFITNVSREETGLRNSLKNKLEIIWFHRGQIKSEH